MRGTCFVFLKKLISQKITIQYGEELNKEKELTYIDKKQPNECQLKEGKEKNKKGKIKNESKKLTTFSLSIIHPKMDEIFFV